jgi:cholesterol transport system auxiliary component
MSHCHCASRLVVVLALAALSGCSTILPPRAPAPNVYRLSVISLPARSEKPMPAQLVVDVPIAMGGLDTDRIVVHDNPYELTYLAGARWTDHAPRLVQSALVQALESTGAFTGVGRQEDGIRRNFELVSDLRAFDVNTEGMGRAHIAIALAAKLLRAPGGEVLATRLFKAEVPANGRGEKDIVAAYDGAMTAIATDMTQWVIENAEQRMPQPVTPAQPAAAPTP